MKPILSPEAYKKWKKGRVESQRTYERRNVASMALNMNAFRRVGYRCPKCKDLMETLTIKTVEYGRLKANCSCNTPQSKWERVYVLVW